MTAVDIVQFFLAIIPSIIVGLVAYYFFKNYIKDQESRRDYTVQKDLKKEVLPKRLLALERMTLYLERIDPARLLVRVKPDSADKFAYETKLIQTIEEEFEHNLTQQIYMSADCWDAIRSTKNATITLIRKSTMHEQVDTADKLREIILAELTEGMAPSATGLAYIKKEVHKIW